MSRFVNPFPQFEDATPTMLSGAKLFFYATGTSTKLNTYTTKALSVANPNPIVLNSAGRASVDIFLQDLEYKVVLAPSTDSDPPSSPIWTADPVSGRDSVLVAKTVTGSGSPNGSVAGTAGSASILPDFYWDYTNFILYVATTTGTSSTTVWTAINASTAAAVVVPPQGYLSLTSGSPFNASDVLAATAVYYGPYVGNIVPIYNGSSLIPTTFIELQLVLNAAHAASKIYDVFVFNNSGVPAIVTGPSWDAGTSGSVTAGSCARGTGAGGAVLARVNGIYTNSVQITGRNGATTYTIAANLATYVGSLFMDTSNGQITCNRAWGKSRKWGVWNAYNRAPIYMQEGTSTATWTASATYPTFAAADADSTNVITTFTGLAEEQIQCQYSQFGLTGATNRVIYNGIGLNSTTALTGTYGKIHNVGAESRGNAIATAIVQPALGINNIQAIVSTDGVSATQQGTQPFMVMTAAYRG